MMEMIIEFKDVGKRYGEKIVMEHLDLAIAAGEIFVLVGPSGSGKTSTLKMLNGLSIPTAGDVYFKGQRIKDYDIQKLRHQIGYVLQQIALFPTMTVKQNIEVIPEMLGWSKEERAQRVDELLELVGLPPEKYRQRLPRELSGGEQQRVGILRAIAAKPDILLMDEPFSALDPLSRTSLQDLVLALHEQLGTTIVFVTHNMSEAMKLADRIAIMREGTLLQVDTPAQIQAQPADKFVEAFFKETEESRRELGQVQDMLAWGTFKKGSLAAELPTVQLMDPVESLYPLLAAHDAVAIENNVGIIRGKDLFTYLSRRAQEDETI